MHLRFVLLCNIEINHFCLSEKRNVQLQSSTVSIYCLHYMALYAPWFRHLIYPVSLTNDLTPFKCINNISYLFQFNKTFTKRFSQRKTTNTYPPTSVEESEPVVSHEEGTTVFTALTWQSSANIIYACIDTPHTQTEGVQQTDRLWKGFWERLDTWHINIKAYYWTICTQPSDG